MGLLTSITLITSICFRKTNRKSFTTHTSFSNWTVQPNSKQQIPTGLSHCIDTVLCIYQSWGHSNDISYAEQIQPWGLFSWHKLTCAVQRSCAMLLLHWWCINALVQLSTIRPVGRLKADQCQTGQYLYCTCWFIGDGWCTFAYTLGHNWTGLYVQPCTIMHCWYICGESLQ